MSAPSSTRARRSFVAGLALALLAGACRPASDESAATPAQPEVMVAAAASLRNVLPTLIDRWGKGKVAVTYGSSGDLRKQVEGGAPVDVVLFASRRPIDQLVEKALVDGEPARIATNRLVLIGPADAKPLTWETLETIPAGERLAVGDPGAVPAGEYAKSALLKLGLWEKLQDRIVLGGDVAAVLAYARRGEVAAAIVYKTETHNIADIAVFAEGTGDAFATAEVIGASTRGGSNLAGGKAFLEWLRSADAQQILADTGFGPP